MNAKPIPPKEIALIVLVFPLLGILMGGIYSYPAMRLTKERDPWLTLLLAVGLSITVFGIGYAAHTRPAYLVSVWLVSVLLLLLARAAFGSLGHSFERFGMVHMATLLILFWVLFFTRNPKQPSPNHALQRTAPAVTARASAAAFPPAMHGPRQPPPSLSLGSLGSLAHHSQFPPMKETEIDMEALIKMLENLQSSIGKQATELDALETLFLEFVGQTGQSEPKWFARLEELKKQRLDSFLLFVENNNPALAAKLDKRKIGQIPTDSETN